MRFARDKWPAFYVPINLALGKLPPAERELAAYFLNLLHWKWICWDGDKRGFIRLKRAYLTSVIPQAIFPRMRNRLVDLGVIDWDRSYVAGERSQGYRLRPEYRKTERIRCTDPDLSRRIIRNYKTMYGRVLPVHRWLAEKLILIEVDMAKAHEIIETLKPDEGSPMEIIEYHELVTGQCRKLANQDHRLDCDAYGRVHTLLTNLPKELRCCLRVHGQPLLGVDLANSQPLIAALRACQFYNSKNARYKLRVKKFDGSGDPYCYRELRQMQGMEWEVSGNLKRFLEICEAGQLYETLMKEGQDRGQYKKQFFSMMFGKNDHWRSRLKAEFPSIAFMLKTIKFGHYQHAAHLMQNLESTIFIHAICNTRIKKERPKLPIYTIHDSILTVPTAIEYVQSIIMDEFDKLGVKPSLHLEDYR